mmetsp:Transcript_7037/g.17961  ORF Transcript_7037/g.17961 Transcript_7037/m.17961 type:complete len:238 (-) Transcript_7037:116-829(-)
MNASTILRQTACRVLKNSRSTTGAAALLRHPPRYLAVASSSSQSWRRFSTAVEETPKAEEKPIIPGIGKGKTSTGLVGLAVEPDWYNVMLKKFQLLLDTMEASDMPETAQYRMNVTKWANFVIATVKANPDDPEAVEDEVRMGQVEELIEMADDEMVCMRMYIQEKFWLELDNEGPEIDFNPDPMRDEMSPDSDPRTRERIMEDMERQRQWVDDEENYDDDGQLYDDYGNKVEHEDI